MSPGRVPVPRYSSRSSPERFPVAFRLPGVPRSPPGTCAVDPGSDHSRSWSRRLIVAADLQPDPGKFPGFLLACIRIMRVYAYTHDTHADIHANG